MKKDNPIIDKNDFNQNQDQKENAEMLNIEKYNSEASESSRSQLEGSKTGWK